MYFISWSQLFGYYMFLFHGHNYLDTICFYFMQYRTLSPSRDARQQEVLNHRDFPDESSDCHVISDELVFEVKFVSKVCQ